MRATVVSEGAERERIWTLSTACLRHMRPTAAKANRTIPIIQLIAP